MAAERKLMLATSETILKGMGAIAGAGIGDALGMPTEFISMEEHKKFFKGKIQKFEDPLHGSPVEHLKRGQYTDDTQQLIALAESLLEKNGLDIVHFGKKLAEWHRKNKDGISNWRFPGNTSTNAAERLLTGVPARESGDPNATTCGSAMRVAPIGVMFYSDVRKAMEKARESSVPTHNSLETKEASAAVAGVIAHLLQGEEPLNAVNKTMEHLKDETLKEKIRKAVELRETEPQFAMKQIGAGSHVHETVPFAIYSFLHSPDDFKKVVVTAANVVPGDTDSIACIAGALAGAHNGIEKIPKEFHSVEEYGRLAKIGARLVKPVLFKDWKV